MVAFYKPHLLYDEQVGAQPNQMSSHGYFKILLLIDALDPPTRSKKTVDIPTKIV